MKKPLPILYRLQIFVYTSHTLKSTCFKGLKANFLIYAPFWIAEQATRNFSKYSE